MSSRVYGDCLYGNSKSKEQIASVFRNRRVFLQTSLLVTIAFD
jgi:hypothetical protein